MDKTKIQDLKKKLFLRSALISIDPSGLSELLSLSDYFSGDEVLFELLKRSLRNF